MSCRCAIAALGCAHSGIDRWVLPASLGAAIVWDARQVNWPEEVALRPINVRGENEKRVPTAINW